MLNSITAISSRREFRVTEDQEGSSIFKDFNLLLEILQQVDFQKGYTNFW